MDKPTIPHSSTPSLLRAPESHQALATNSVIVLQQRCYIHVQRTVHFRIRQEVVDSFEGGGESVGGRPGIFEKVDTYFSCLVSGQSPLGWELYMPRLL